MAMSIIKVNNLTKTYGNFTAVNHVSFEVEKGTLLGFLGVNGAGKTTVINMLATLLEPDDGTAEICGEILGKKDQEIRRKIGIVYQQNCLDDILTVRENLICRGIIHGASKAEAKEQCVRLTEILKLGDILKKKYRMLSGGQKRRCEIAAALMHTPEILFLDEPTTGLDPATRLDVWNTIEELQKNEKMTVFLTTHYMEEAAGADKIIIMDHGNIITSGAPFELKERFAADKLRLYCKTGKEYEIMRTEKMISLMNSKNEEMSSKSEGMKGKSEESNRKYEKTDGEYGGIQLLGNRVVEMLVRSTLDALPIINMVENMIDGFEVIQGNMDDVFLNAVGRNLIETEAE